MAEDWPPDETAPEAQITQEEEPLTRWPLVPRSFKAMVVASPVFGISMGLSWDFVHALAFAAVAIILFVVGAVCYARWRTYRENRLPS